jgi:hypothetical protein
MQVRHRRSSFRRNRRIVATAPTALPLAAVIAVFAGEKFLLACARTIRCRWRRGSRTVGFSYARIPPTLKYRWRTFCRRKSRRQPIARNVRIVLMIIKEGLWDLCDIAATPLFSVGAPKSLGPVMAASHASIGHEWYAPGQSEKCADGGECDEQINAKRSMCLRRTPIARHAASLGHADRGK